MVYRVRRIETLLGVDLDDPAAVFDITLALRVLDLLGESVAGSVGVSPDVGGPPRDVRGLFRAQTSRWHRTLRADTR